MAFHHIAKEKLDRWWLQTCEALKKNSQDWDAATTQVLLRNEYARIGEEPPNVDPKKDGRSSSKKQNA